MSEPRIRLLLSYARTLRDHLDGGKVSPSDLRAAASGLKHSVAACDVGRTLRRLASADRAVKPPALPFAKPDPADRKAKARREDAAQARKDRAVYRAVAMRAAGMCECACGRELDFHGPDSVGQMDHFRGRGKAPTALDNTWLIRAGCHRNKTENRPSRAEWLERFLRHCRMHGYREQADRCVRELQAERDIERAAEVSRVLR